MVKNKGFTLIEIMVVIAILGILASVIVPLFQDSARGSHINTDVSTDNSIMLINGVRHSCSVDGDCVPIE